MSVSYKSNKGIRLSKQYFVPPTGQKVGVKNFFGSLRSQNCPHFQNRGAAHANTSLVYISDNCNSTPQHAEQHIPAHNGPRTTNAAEGWRNSLNTHFGTPHPSLRVFLRQTGTACRSASSRCRSSRCIQLAAGRPPKQKVPNYETVNTQLLTAKLEYGMEIGRIFAAPDMIRFSYLSRVYFRSVTDNYIRRCSHLLGCN